MKYWKSRFLCVGVKWGAGEDNVGFWERTRSFETEKNKREDEEEENLHHEVLTIYVIIWDC
jgi:hypothetical protein